MHLASKNFMQSYKFFLVFVKEKRKLFFFFSFWFKNNKLNRFVPVGEPRIDTNYLDGAGAWSAALRAKIEASLKFILKFKRCRAKRDFTLSGNFSARAPLISCASRLFGELCSQLFDNYHELLPSLRIHLFKKPHLPVSKSLASSVL